MQHTIHMKQLPMSCSEDAMHQTLQPRAPGLLIVGEPNDEFFVRPSGAAQIKKALEPLTGNEIKVYTYTITPDGRNVLLIQGITRAQLRHVLSAYFKRLAKIRIVADLDELGDWEGIPVNCREQLA